MILTTPHGRVETRCPGTDSCWHDPSLEKTPPESNKYRRFGGSTSGSSWGSQGLRELSPSIQAGRLRAACNPTAHAALNSQFTFFSSMARSRKRRSQFDIGVSFMLSNQETKYWNPPGKQNFELLHARPASTAAQRIDVIKARCLKLGKPRLAGRR